MDQIHIPLEGVRGADRDLERGDLLAERGPQTVERLAGVRGLPIALVEEEDRRMAALAGERYGVLEAGFDVARGVHEEERRVGGRKSLDDLGGEVRVAGGIHDLDPVALSVEARHGQAQRLMPLLLFGLVIHARRAVIDATETRDGAVLEEEPLGQRRLAGAGVGGDDDAAEVGEVDALGCHLLNRSFGGDSGPDELRLELFARIAAS